MLLAGVVVALITFLPSHHAAPTQAANAVKEAITPKAAPTPKTVPLSKAATSVARQFVTTAVAREDLAAAWKISDANIRGGLTYKEWLSGNIPVVPYPVSAQTGARFKIDWSWADEAGLEIVLMPKDAKKVKPQLFFIRLKKIGPAGGKHWVVDTWVPHSTPMVPLGANH